MVRSKAVHFFQKKNENIFFNFFCYCICFTFSKKSGKNRDARFFRSKAVHDFFSDFLKKVEKIGKNEFFSLFSLWSQGHFHQFRHYHLSCKRCKNRRQKKTQKKGDFNF